MSKDLPPRYEQDKSVVYLDDYRSKLPSPEGFSDADVVDFFLSMMTHPSSRMSGSQHMAEKILDYVGSVASHDLRDDRMAWRQRIQAIVVDIDSLEIDVHDELVEADAVLDLIYKQARFLRDTHPNTMATERHALVALRGLRARVLLDDMIQNPADGRWRSIIAALGRTENA